MKPLIRRYFQESDIAWGYVEGTGGDPALPPNSTEITRGRYENLEAGLQAKIDSGTKKQALASLDTKETA